MVIAPAENSAQTHYEARLAQRHASAHQAIWNLLDAVCDPEIPVLSLWDLGIITHVEQQANTVHVTITPTYSGCSALDVMRDDIRDTLNANGYAQVEVKTQLAPAWSSTWISPEGRAKLRRYGIAPPNPNYCAQQQALAPIRFALTCPHCGSRKTHQVSEFGSTACKSLHQCDECQEPFDYFKTI